MNKLITDTMEALSEGSDTTNLLGVYASILDCIIEAQHSIFDFDAGSIENALAELEYSHKGQDFTFDFDGNEYRIIHKDAIDSIYQNEIRSIVESCYDLKLDKIPSFIAVSIDWEQTAKNSLVDGYGHTFSSYDGSEENVNGWHIFRTN